ncbi:regulator of G-protein signaling 14-like isoform X2 [Myxocyprinus asiaticus]|uniref:regulator of G-protein signaling 14-like isoform X2 n=1 Tax=Myxocyprinus asiaticus TaxID=70543 RepID=UPI0022233B79|nr:regulator of G-protein signaling 14-like isoform X2 [Myxocyprinus asiaticus]
MSLKEKSIGISNGFKTLAVSDGELNVLEIDEHAATQYSSSNSSLPTVPSDRARGVGQVASWAVSFERLLEDSTGVHYFTAFLKSEVSAENILFWLACEKFRKIPANQTEQLRREALSIYNSFLSSSATSPINIDDRVRVEEKDVQNPHSDIFQKAQQQIFKLMKFDSYTRFVRSQLYQRCMLANVEGRPLPGLDSRGKPLTSTKHTSSTSPREQAKTDNRTKERLKFKSGTAEADDVVERRKVNLQGMIGKDKRKEKRGSWGESPNNFKSVLKSSEVDKLVARSAEGRADKYCCVFLPDGTASLTPARPGLTVRSMLTGLCEKRGLPLTDIIIYLQGKDKQPLSLDQDSSVLKDQQVYLELRVTFAVKVAFTGKTVAVVVKSNKTLQDALTTVLNKYHLRPQDTTVTMDRRGAVDAIMFPPGISRSTARQRNPGLRRTYDMEGLVELLNRAQCCSADDQRGLLKKEHLMLPQFLQLPLDEVEETETSRSLEGSLEVSSPAASIQADSQEERLSESKNSNPARETVV